MPWEDAGPTRQTGADRPGIPHHHRRALRLATAHASPVGQLVVGSVRIDLEAQDAAVELEGAVEALADDGHVVDAPDADRTGEGGRRGCKERETC